MRKLITLVVLLLCFSSFSQQNINTSLVIFPEVHPSGWSTYVSNSDFKIEYKFTDCDPDMGYDFETVILRITNKINQQLDFSWHIDIYREGACRTCDYEVEYRRTISLAANQVIEGDCVRNSNIQLKVFSQFNDANYTKGAKLTGFQLNDFTVTQ